jgi:sugar/nucleoside kinase (ribokinase family)
MNDSKKYKLTVLGSSIVDVLSHQEEKFLGDNNLSKGSMQLVAYEEIKNLYDSLGSIKECSGGSAANTAAGFAMLGGKCAFIGKSKNDRLGELYREEIEKVGVEYTSEHTESGISTAKCLVLVTENADENGVKKFERTMITYLDAEIHLTENDINEETIKNSEVIFFEGYLFDNPEARKAVLKAVRIAEQNNIKVSFTLSDPFCVDRHREDFTDLVENHADMIFANEHEAAALFKKERFEDALEKFKPLNPLCFITRSEKGSVIVDGGKVNEIAPILHNQVTDVTGAGDIYASGVLYGLTHGMGLVESGNLGSACASEVVKQIGARPERNLKELLQKQAA